MQRTDFRVGGRREGGGGLGLFEIWEGLATGVAAAAARIHFRPPSRGLRPGLTPFRRCAAGGLRSRGLFAAGIRLPGSDVG